MDMPWDVSGKSVRSKLCICRVAGAYYDAEGYIDGTFNTHFLKLSTAEKTKNLELAKAVLQAETNKQLKDYRIPETGRKPGSIWQLLDGIKESGLQNDAFLDLLYEMIGERVAPGKESYCFLFHGIYDVPVKGTDKEWQEGSEEVYNYLLYRAEGSPEMTKPSGFEDVAADTYYTAAVAWAAENGIVYGVSETLFEPETNITREQIAAILYRYAFFKGYDMTVGEDTNILSYEDFAEISEYAIKPLTWTAGTGILAGRTASTLNPQENATRAEAATVLKRLFELNK